MASTPYAFTRGLDYDAIVSASEQVAWTVDDVLDARSFDAARTMVPTSWVGTDGLPFLDAEAQRTLNHCRAFSYVHLLGNYEEFIPFHLSALVQQEPYGGRSQRRALLRFGDEEMKHQALFHGAETLLERSCGHPFGRHFDREGTRCAAFARAFLEHGSLARFLLLLAFEWGTQRHYVESIRDRTADPLYADVLRAHWVEEAQHVKSDTLEIARLAAGMRDTELDGAFEQLGSLGQLIDATLAGQASQEVETLHAVTGRTLLAAEAATLREVLHRSLSAIIVGVALGHPSFARVARDVSPTAAARLFGS
jgi:hypothetical protein